MSSQVVYDVFTRNVEFGVELNSETCHPDISVYHLRAGCVLQSVRAILRATLSGVRVSRPMVPRE